MNFIKRRIERYKVWFEKPTTIKDRMVSAFVGSWAGIWIGGLGRIIYETPVSMSVVGYFALAGACICLVIGATVPKYSRILFLPFAFMTIDSN